MYCPSCSRPQVFDDIQFGTWREKTGEVIQSPSVTKRNEYARQKKIILCRAVA